MKKLLILIAFASIILVSCKEEGPYINFREPDTDTGLIDTTYIAAAAEASQLKNVLIEDFTGVQCLNCPKAALKLDTIIRTNSGRVFGIAVHTPNSFGAPMSGSKEDYRTSEDSNIWNYMFNSSTQPAGAVDRVKYPGESQILTAYGSWVSYVNQRLAIGISPVNIHLMTEYDIVEKVHEVYVTVFFNQTNTFANYLSVTLVEDSIIDWQKMPGTGQIDSYYVHNHVLRKMLTPYNGLKLMDNPEQKRVFMKEFWIKPKPTWNLKHMKVIAFVSKWDGLNDYEVFQTEEIEVK